jgi:hypothetical protein
VTTCNVGARQGARAGEGLWTLTLHSACVVVRVSRELNACKAEEAGRGTYVQLVVVGTSGATAGGTVVPRSLTLSSSPGWHGQTRFASLQGQKRRERRELRSGFEMSEHGD